MKACALVVLAAVIPGCAWRSPSWKGEVAWPDEHSARLVASPMEAGAALAAAGAIREVVRTNPHPHLFRGCSSPEQGLDVVVFTGPTSGLYYVVVHPRFDRCGGPIGRVLDGWDAYAVTPQGEVVAKAPPPAGETPVVAPAPLSQPTSEPKQTSAEQPLPPHELTPAPAPPTRDSGTESPAPMPSPESVPAAPPPAETPPAASSVPPATPSPG
jgi:hypothetical protein